MISVRLRYLCGPLHRTGSAGRRGGDEPLDLERCRCRFLDRTDGLEGAVIAGKTQVRRSLELAYRGYVSDRDYESATGYL
jgi:hypothetical protein